MKKAAPPPAAPEPVVPEPTPFEVLDEAFSHPAPPVSATVVPARRSGAALAIGFTAVTLLVAGAAALGGAAWNESRPDTYASSAVLLIDQEPALTFAPDGGLIAKLSSLRIKYSDLTRTATFAQDLNAKTGLPAGVIHGSLSAQVPPASLLLQVTSTSTDRAVPPVVAQAAAEKLRDDLAKSQESEGVPAKARVTLTVVSPSRAAVVTSPSRKRSLELGGGAFGATLLGAALLWDLTRRRRYREGLPA